VNILLGICGSVAAIKGALLARALFKKGHICRVVLTKGGREFITPLQITSLTGEPCYTDEDFFVESEVPLHLELASWADVFVVAPLSANTLARFRMGVADDILSAIYMSFKGIVLLAPAMHDTMWKAPGTQENIRTLIARGNIFLGPYEGELSTGEVGTGRMAEPEEILSAIEDIGVKSNVLRGKKILITLGRTEEELDPIRVITNRSSGKMGLSLMQVLSSLGADVYVVAGEVSVPLPDTSKIRRVRSGEEMYNTVKTLMPQMDVLIMAAAVSDFRPREIKKSKIRRGKALTVEFEPTRDILKDLSREKRKGQIFVGFALEEDNLLEQGKEKLKEKNLEMLVANRFRAIGSDITEGFIIERDKAEEFKDLTKTELAMRIADWLVNIIEKK